MARMKCPRCEGSGQCSDCQGTGQIPCPNCEGSGQRTSSRGSTYPCKSCKGQGQVDCSPRCPSCEGSGEITPDLQRKVREKYEVRFDNTNPLSKVTHSAVFLCILIYVIGQARPELGGWLDLQFGNLASAALRQPWRLLTFSFLHAGLAHLAFNTLFLLRYGPWVEGLYGSRRYLGLWLVASLSSGLLSALLNPPSTLTVGASGVAFGLLGVMLGLSQRFRLFQGDHVRELLTSGLVFTVVALWLIPTSVDHLAHLGGFLGGFAYAWMTPRPKGR